MKTTQLPKVLRSLFGRVCCADIQIHWLTIIPLLFATGLCAQVAVITFDGQYQAQWLPDGTETENYSAIGIDIVGGATSYDVDDFVIEAVLPTGMEVYLTTEPLFQYRTLFLDGTPDFGTAGDWNISITVKEYSNHLLVAQGTFNSSIEIIGSSDNWGPFVFTGDAVTSGELKTAFINRTYKSETIELSTDVIADTITVTAPDLDSLGLSVKSGNGDIIDHYYFFVKGTPLAGVAGTYEITFTIGSPSWPNSLIGEITLTLEIREEPTQNIQISKWSNIGFNSNDGRLMPALVGTPYDSSNSFWADHCLLVKNSLEYTIDVENIPPGLDPVTTEPEWVSGSGGGIKSRLSLEGVPTEAGTFLMRFTATDVFTASVSSIQIEIIVKTNPSSGDMLFGGPPVGFGEFPPAKAGSIYPPHTNMPPDNIEIDSNCRLLAYWADDQSEVDLSECTIAYDFPTDMVVQATTYNGAPANELQINGIPPVDADGNYLATVRIRHTNSGKVGLLTMPLHIVSRAKLLTTYLPDRKEGQKKVIPIRYETTDTSDLTVEVDGLPPGMDWTEQTAQFKVFLNGIPANDSASETPYPVTVTLTFDKGGPNEYVDERTYNLMILEGEVVVEATPPPSYPEGLKIAPVVLDVSDGFAPYTVTSTGLPNGIKLEGVNLDDGNVNNDVWKITGTPAIGSSLNNPYTVTITAIDKHGHQGEIQFELEIEEPVELPDVVLGKAYIHQLDAPTWGTAPYTQSTVGDFPPGLSLNGDWQISGFPLENGVDLEPYYFVTLTIQDSSSFVNKRVIGLLLTIKFHKLTIQTNSLSFGQEGIAYQMPLAITGGYGEYHVQASNLPAGLTLSHNVMTETYEIKGVPTVGSAANYNVSLGVLDSAEDPDSFYTLLSLTVFPEEEISGPATTVTTSTIPNGREGEPYGPVVLEASGGESGIFDWSQSGGLPVGLNFSQLGNGTWTIDGTPIVGSASTYFVYLVAADIATPGQSATAILPLTIHPNSTTTDETTNPASESLASALVASGAAGCQVSTTQHDGLRWWIFCGLITLLLFRTRKIRSLVE